MVKGSRHSDIKDPHRKNLTKMRKPGKCCDICGDLGIIDTIVTCAQCKNSHEHLYCMRIYHDDHPQGWYCEECEDLIEASLLNTPGKLEHHSNRPNQLKNDLKRNFVDHRKKIQIGKVKLLSLEEVIMLTSGAKKSGSAVNSSLRRAPFMSRGIGQKSNSKSG